MSVLRSAVDRLEFDFDLERVEFIRSSRVPLAERSIRLEGGPCAGLTRTMSIAPDTIILPGEGLYLPLLAEPTTYVWMPEQALLDPD